MCKGEGDRDVLFAELVRKKVGRWSGTALAPARNKKPNLSNLATKQFRLLKGSGGGGQNPLRD